MTLPPGPDVSTEGGLKALELFLGPILGPVSGVLTAVVAALGVVAVIHPVFVLAVNAPRGGLYRRTPLLWSLAAALGLLGLAGALMAELWLTPGLYLLWACLYLPFGLVDLGSRAVLLAGGRVRTARGRRGVRVAVDALTVWPAWILPLVGLAELALGGADGPQWAWGGLALALCLVLPLGRPLRRYTPTEPGDVRDHSTPRAMLWLPVAGATAVLGALALVAVVPTVDLVLERGLVLTNGTFVAGVLLVAAAGVTAVEWWLRPASLAHRGFDEAEPAEPAS